MIYYDFHSHILPGMDDGSENGETSAQMLRTLKLQGVRHVIFSPHFYPDAESAEDFYIRRGEAVKRLMEVYDKDTMPSFTLGAEVAMRPGVSRADLQRTCLGGKFIMLEMPPGFGDWILDETERILLQGFKPIFAHIERPMMGYRECDFQKLIDYRSFIYQINVGALEVWKIRRYFLKEFKKGAMFILGSDCHNMTSRAPDFDSKALKSRAVRGEFAQAVQRNSEYILNKVGESNDNKQRF